MGIDSVSSEGANQADLKRAKRVRKQQPEPGPLDRLPPHAPDSEKGCLGCVMIAPNETMPELIVGFGNAGKEVFYDMRHQAIYQAMEDMHEKQLPIDIINLHQFLKDRKLLEQVGGLAYLSTLPDSVPSAANVSYYIEIVKEKYTLRKGIYLCTDFVGRVYDWEGDVDKLMDDFERDALRIRELSKSESIPKMNVTVSKAIQTIEDFAFKKVPIGIPTGFADYDKMTCGLIRKEVTVIAARPSMGKTSLGMNIVEHVALIEKKPVGVFSLEMDRDSLILRALCSRAKVNLRNVKDGFLADQDFPKITGAAGKLSNAPIYIDDTRGLSIMNLRARARRMKQMFGCELFLIDYLQLLHATLGGRELESRQREVGIISRGVKEMAGELNVPVIVLSQLNRDVEKNNRKPTMADLRESGDIEQDADTIGLLYKPKLSDDDEAVDEYKEATSVNLLIAKQRNGPTGEVNLTFLKQFTRFENAPKVTDEDVPSQQQATMI